MLNIYDGFSGYENGYIGDCQKRENCADEREVRKINTFLIFTKSKFRKKMK